MRQSTREQAKAFDTVPKKAKAAAQQAGKAVSGMAKEVSSKTKQIRKDVDQAMEGAVKSVRRRGRAGEVGCHRGRHRRPHPLASLDLQSAGANAMAGFTAVSAPRAPRRSRPRCRSPTRSRRPPGAPWTSALPPRVMKKIGGFVSQGFARGILGGLKEVKKATKKLWNQLDRKEGKKKLAGMRKQFANELALIRQNARLRDQLDKRIAATQKRLADLRGAQGLDEGDATRTPPRSSAPSGRSPRPTAGSSPPAS